MDKRSYILEKLVEEYIKVSEPISSKHLQKSLSISISSATIRYYFQQLSQSGAIKQTHISSGRIPTGKTLKEFWKKRLNLSQLESNDVVSKLETISQKEKIFCEFNMYKTLYLRGVDVYKDKFLICDFEQSDFIIPYNKNIERFFKNQIGQEGLKLASICKDIGLTNISKGLKKFLTKDFGYFMLNELIDICKEDINWAQNNLKKILEGDYLIESPLGLKFYNDTLSFKFFVKENEKRGEVLLVGKLYRNYQNLINQLKGD